LIKNLGKFIAGISKPIFQTEGVWLAISKASPACGIRQTEGGQAADGLSPD
jgi:hypothetical protein